MQVTTFDKAQVHFDQMQCAICHGQFTETDVVTSLACQHLFHSNCLGDHIRCPICRKPLLGRAKNYTKEEIEQAVREFGQHLQVFRQLFPFVTIHFPAENVADLVNNLMNQNNQISSTNNT